MKRTSLVGLILIVIILSGWAGRARAVEEGQPFQLALFYPLQIRGEDASITGLRLNLIYGKNVSVSGLDIGIANHCTGGQSVGVQYGLLGLVEGDFVGWQHQAISIVNGEFAGLQWGLFNYCGHGTGFQAGFVNRAKYIKGLQFGLLNYSDSMYGLQIGLVNIIQDKENLPVFVIANWSF
jgi:hypothetical protein